MNKGIDELLGEIRTRYGLRQKDLADVAGVTQATASRWETGATMSSHPYVVLIADEYPSYRSALFEAVRGVPMTNNSPLGVTDNQSGHRADTRGVKKARFDHIRAIPGDQPVLQPKHSSR